MSDSSFVFLFPLSLPHLGCPLLKSIIPKILLYSYCFSAQEFKRTPFDPLFKPKLSLWHWKPFNSVQFSCSVMSNSLWPHGLEHARLPCPSPTPGAYSDSCPSSQWCLSPSSPAFDLSQHQGLFQQISSLHQVAKVLEFQLEHQSFQWIFRTDSL